MRAHARLRRLLPALLIGLLAVGAGAQQTFQLFAAQTEAGSSDAVIWPSTNEGCGNLVVEGTWNDGATVALEKSLDGGATWSSQYSDGTAQSWTANDEVRLCLFRRHVRVTLSCDTDCGTTSISVWLGG